MSEKIVYIKFFTEIDKNSIKSLMNIIEQKLREETTKFVILISNSGGNVFAGVTGYNFLKGIPAEVETHNFGSAISIALVLFCAGKKRLSVPHATFLLHGVQANFQQGA
ncbi:MAG: ATP-dependent Clp protease proteolytic subunit, partial [Nitrospirota bacterium]